MNCESLTSLFKDDFNFTKRITELSIEVQKDKDKIYNMTKQYGNKYRHEIEEGTKRKQILLTEGLRSGKSIEEVEKSIGFIPSNDTPILNWLYFSMKENDDVSKEIKRTELNDECKSLLHEDSEVNGMEKVPDVFVVLSGKNISYDNFKKLKKLKKLATRNDNRNEAFEAYTTCIRLCDQWNIKFDSIPE